MIRALIVLFWLSLLIGTLLAHNLVANWAVALAGLYFLARWWTGRSRKWREAHAAAQPAIGSDPVRGASQAPAMAATPLSGTQPRSRWTVDRVHTAEHRWH
jgi:hypothetical protein